MLEVDVKVIIDSYGVQRRVSSCFPGLEVGLDCAADQLDVTPLCSCDLPYNLS